jgi:hypothetical protein
MKLQCVTKGKTGNNVEYHITWANNNKQYRSYYKVD